jgi:hypothetical protein
VVDPDLIDTPAPPGTYEVWLKPLAVYMRRISIKGERLDLADEGDGPVRLPKRGPGARHLAAGP